MVMAGSQPARAEWPAPRRWVSRSGQLLPTGPRGPASRSGRAGGQAGGPWACQPGAGAGKANLGMEKGGAEATYKGYTGGVIAETTGRRGGIGQSGQAD